MKNKMLGTIGKYKQQMKKGGLLFLVFLLVKSLVFFAPLAISYILKDVELYGKFEYSLNLGQTFLSVFSMGLGSALAYFTLRKNAVHLKPAFHLHFVIASLVLLLIFLIFPSLSGNLVFGAAIIGLAFAHQLFNSSVLKLEDKNIKSVFIDSALYFLMAGYAIILYMKIIPFNIAQWHVLVLIHVVLSNLAGLKKVKGFDKITKQEYAAIYKYGIYSVIGGLCLFALSNNTRLFIEHYTSFQDVGIYSFYFRVASLVVILYRVMGILMYKKYFVSDHSKIDTFFAILILSLFIINCFIYLVLLALPKYFPHAIGASYIKYIDLYILIIFQVSAWIGIALFESIINREFLTKQMILVLIPCIGLFLLTLYFFNNYNLISLKSIVALNTCFILSGNIGQILILKRRTFFYKRTLTVQIIISILFTLYITI